MCDYSLKSVKSRPARVGERLTTHDFHTGTIGFRASDDLAPGAAATAVCVLPGTEIAFAEPARVQNAYPFEAKVGEETKLIGTLPVRDECMTTFIQVNKDDVMRHHDALLFPDGSIVLLNCLAPGQRASILTLPAPARTPAESAVQRRAEYV